MPYRPLPRFSQTRQPQGAVEVDWSNPRTRGLQFAFYGALVEAVSRRLPAVQTGTIITTELGLAANATSAATGFRWDLPTTIAGTTPITVMASQLCYASNTTVKNLFRLEDSSGGFAAAFRHGNGSTNLYYALVASTTDSFGITRSSVKTPSANVRRTTTYYHSGAAATRPVFWVDGEFENTSDASGTGTRRSISRVVLLNGNLSSQVFNGNVPWLYLFDREVPVEEQVEIFANPWQIFRAPPRRLYVQVGGGTSTRTVTAAGGFDLGGTSNLLRQVARAASGGIDLGGTAAQARVVARVPSGGFDLGGVAPALRYRVSTGSGGVAFGGTAPAVGFRGITVEGDGGIAIGGEVIPLRYRTVSADGGLALGGTAAVSFVGGAITARVIRVVIPGGGVRSYTI